MASNPLLKVQELGQSIWLDYLRRRMLTSGELKQLIEDDGLRGVTSNPKIFQKAIGGSHDYDEAIEALARAGRSVEEIYRTLTVEDVQNAADLFRPVYDETNGRDGFVSLEVSPHLAHDTEGTIKEARELWGALDRPNVFIKVPATIEGLPAIEQLISEGINVNVTLLFGLPRYREAANAYVAGLEKRVAAGKPLDHVASVASFFLSRIDVLVDSLLDKQTSGDAADSDGAARLRGKVAIACAKCAYPIYEEVFGGKRFQGLIDQGARSQRLLWASTSTKDPSYSDVKYVDALIGPETINTMPPETLDAFRDHGDPAPRLWQGVDEAQHLLRELPRMDIDLDAVTQQLEDEGVEKFIKPYDQLMDTLRNERQAALGERPDRQAMDLGENQSAAQECVSRLEKQRFSRRLWRKEPALWKADRKSQQMIAQSLGWLHVADVMEDRLSGLFEFVDEVKEAGFRHVVHMGMGGSSLAPLVFGRTFGPSDDGLPLTVLDTTDPATIGRVLRDLPMEQTLFIEASKSGTTAESCALGELFYEVLTKGKGDRAGEQFVAITDPGTPLASRAEERGFRRVFLNMPDIGGRYSALSYFGLVPAALTGLDIAEVLDRAQLMMQACAGCVPAGENPGLTLGCALGELAQGGRDKVTFLTPDGVASLGLWLEQLLAESTGKDGTGLTPIVGEPCGEPDAYDQDRVFVHFRLETEVAPQLEQFARTMREAGHPVITITMADRMDIAQEFFRWEIATATAGAVLGINPFDQPNVQESKDNTNRLLETLRKKGRLPADEPIGTEGALRVFGNQPAGNVTDILTHFFEEARPGDYVAMMAYLTEEPGIDNALQQLRVLARDGLHRATTVGYGPRFLHSTGQLHKGGPNNGLYLQLTADDPEDLDVPGAPYTFGALRRAQWRGDLEALRRHDRRVMRVHLGADAGSGLNQLVGIVSSHLASAARA